MSEKNRWTTTMAAVAVLLAGGLTGMSAQETDQPVLDVDAMAEQMELDDETRAELAQLGDLLQRRAAMRASMTELHTQMRETMQGLASRLTFQQFHELHQEMRPMMQMGPSGDRGMHRGGKMGEGAHMRNMRHHHGSGQTMREGGMHRRAGMGTCPWFQEAPDRDDANGTS